MTGVQILACFWTLLLAQSGFVCSDIQFLERHEGESVVLPCAVEQRNLPPFGVYLKRSWLQPTNVLFMYTKSDSVVENDADQHRVSVSGDPSSHALNVTISELRVSDTDRYHCEFYFNNPSSEDDRIRGNTEFFLLVTAGHHCSCSSYATLLYAVSSAAALLLVSILIGLVVMYKGKARHRVKSHPQAPIYEEMVGVKPPSRKTAPHHLEETESSEYRNCHVKKSCHENHYESPSGALFSRIN